MLVATAEFACMIQLPSLLVGEGEFVFLLGAEEWHPVHPLILVSNLHAVPENQSLSSDGAVQTQALKSLSTYG